MSLIQEALKRQQQEQGNKAGPETPPSPAGSEPPVTETMPVPQKLTLVEAAPAPAAEPSAPASSVPVPAMPPPPPVPSSKPWMMIGGIGVAAFIVLVIGGLIVAKWTLKMTQKKAVPALAVPSVKPSQPSGIPVSQAKPEANSSVPPPPSVSAREGPAAPAALSPVPSSPVSIPPVPSATASREPESPLPPLSDTSGTENIPETESPSMEKTPPVPLQWPVLKLTGMLSSPTPGEGAARINNQMIFVGGEIEGAILVEIRSDGVLLRYGDETRFLKMGGVMY